MTARYQLSETAESELGEILLYLARREGVERALHVHGHFVRAFELLAEQPGSGTKRPRLTGERVRWWPVFKWIVVYDPESAPITVLRVVHGARELDRVLRPDETRE